MRRIVILLTLVLGFTSVKSQDYKVVDSCKTMFIYSYQFYETRKLPESRRQQEMVLEMGKNCSKFYSTAHQYADSLIMLHINEPPEVAYAKIAPMIGNQSGHMYTSFRILKNYPKVGVTLFTASDMTPSSHYKVEEELDFGWKVDGNDKTTIMGYTCTKATCRFAGRDYEAWFTTQIPISDGPYKFSGLPGLIVKIADSEGEHVFELQEVKNVSSRPIYFSNRNYIATDAKGYIKALEASKTGYVEIMRGLSNSDEARLARIMAQVQKRNNFIERY